MKKTLYWALYIPMGILMIVFMLIHRLFELSTAGLYWITELPHHFEAWCFDYKTRYPDMHYKGDGIWSSFKD